MNMNSPRVMMKVLHALKTFSQILTKYTTVPSRTRLFVAKLNEVIKKFR